MSANDVTIHGYPAIDECAHDWQPTGTFKGWLCEVCSRCHRAVLTKSAS